MKTTEFFLPMIPPTVTHQQKKVAVVNGKPFFYETPEVKAARAKFMAALNPHRPAEKFKGPIRMITKWLWPCGDKHYDGEWRDTKPDTDNIIKLFKDCANKVGFFHEDDCQVASEIVEKFWASTPGIWVRIEELTK